MADNKLTFLIKAFPAYTVRISDDGIHAVISNPFYDENINIYFYEEDDYTPFCVCFSFQHSHLTDEDRVIDWINDIISGNTLAIEFFKNEQQCFGSDITAEELAGLSYAKLEQLFGFLTKLLETADSFKVRGWEKKNNFDAVFVLEADGTITIEKSYV